MKTPSLFLMSALLWPDVRLVVAGLPTEPLCRPKVSLFVMGPAVSVSAGSETRAEPWGLTSALSVPTAEAK